MSSHPHRNRGSLFANGDKRKPSQPDMRGDCTLDGAAYEITAWHREDQLALALAPARDRQKNAQPPDAFRGALDEAPKRSSRDKDGPEKPVWVGDIVGDEQRYSVRAFKKQGKSGPYLTLYFEGVEPGAGDEPGEGDEPVEG